MIMATLEVKAMTNLLNRLAESCWDKCVSAKLTTAELQVGELACDDRCAIKYMEVSTLVGQSIAKMNATQMAQQQMGQEQGQGGGGR